jgi:hypothetical protein
MSSSLQPGGEMSEVPALEQEDAGTQPDVVARSSMALVESPAQLLNVLEWAHTTGTTGDSLSLVVLAPRLELSRLQLRRMAAIARTLGFAVHWHEPRLGGASTARTVRSLAGNLSGVTRLILGDPFSGVMQVVVSISRPSEVVIVDDGTATLEFARQWAAGEDLVRWHTRRTPAQRRQIMDFARGQLAYSARRRMAPESGCCLSIFTCMPVALDRIPVKHNDFSWVRSQFPAPVVKTGGDLIGTSLVETGVVDLDRYLQAVQRLAVNHRIDRYLAHRKEGAEKLARIAALGLTVIRPELPLELVARRGPIGSTIVSFPSTVVHTLPLVLSDTGVRLLVCDVDDQWFTPQASATSDRFLTTVTRTARSRHGLSAVAC